MVKTKKYCFDIDGTICSTNCHYKDAKPYIDIIKFINQLYDEGNYIILFTSRGTKSGKDWHNFTKKQLINWKIKYNELIMGKPQADIFIDDRSVNIIDWCDQNKLKY